MILETYGIVPNEHREQCERWFPQTEDDAAISRQVMDEHLRPGDRVWCAVPPSVHVPRIYPGDTFDERIVDSGEGPVACCTVEAIYPSRRRWVVYWSSGKCWGMTEYDKIQQQTIVRTTIQKKRSK